MHEGVAYIRRLSNLESVQFNSQHEELKAAARNVIEKQQHREVPAALWECRRLILQFHLCDSEGKPLVADVAELDNLDATDTDTILLAINELTTPTDQKKTSTAIS